MHLYLLLYDIINAYLKNSVFWRIYKNKQNGGIWDEDIQRIIDKKPLYPQRDTVWSAVGLHVFANSFGEAVTVNYLRYHNILTE